MIVFETWPPSSALVSLVFAAVACTLGLKFGCAIVLGAGAMRLGEWLDTYGTTGE